MIIKTILIAALLLPPSVFATESTSSTKIWPFDEQYPIHLGQTARFSSHHESLTINPTLAPMSALVCFRMTACPTQGYPKMIEDCRNITVPASGSLQVNKDLEMLYPAVGGPRDCDLNASTEVIGPTPSVTTDHKTFKIRY